MSVPNHYLTELRRPSEADDAATVPLAAPQVARAHGIARVFEPARDWCYGVIDRAFGFDLREEELRELRGSEPPPR